MNFIKTTIDGVILVEPRIFMDERGYFFESYNADIFYKNGIENIFIQDNQSRSHYGVIRGLHFQNGTFAQAKLVRVLQGRILDIAVDIRENSPTFGQHVAYELSDENQHQLFIPRGFAHGFSVLSEHAVVAYKCDNTYHPAAESGIRYNDPALGVDWKIPMKDISISTKDDALQGLQDVTAYRG